MTIWNLCDTSVTFAGRRDRPDTNRMNKMRSSFVNDSKVFHSHSTWVSLASTSRYLKHIMITSERDNDKKLRWCFIEKDLQEKKNWHRWRIFACAKRKNITHKQSLSTMDCLKPKTSRKYNFSELPIGMESTTKNPAYGDLKIANRLRRKLSNSAQKHSFTKSYYSRAWP